MIVMYTPQEIQDLRIDMRMTLKEFGEKLDVCESAVAHWESGRTHPRYRTLEKLNALADEFRGNGHKKKVAV